MKQDLSPPPESKGGAPPEKERAPKTCGSAQIYVDRANRASILRLACAALSAETDVRLQQLLDLAADPCPDVREIALADIAREFPKYL